MQPQQCLLFVEPSHAPMGAPYSMEHTPTPTWARKACAQRRWGGGGALDTATLPRLDAIACVCCRSPTFTPNIVNAVMSYGSGGYEVQLPSRDPNATAAALASLQQDFIDAGTRAVAFGFSLYSPVLDEVTVSQFLVEVSPSRWRGGLA